MTRTVVRADFAGRARYAVLACCARCARHVRALGLVAGIRAARGALLDAREIRSDDHPLGGER
jgi:hypothetical protein